MAEGEEGTTTYTEDQVEARIAEANKAIERSRNEALADKRRAREEADELRKQLGELQSKMQDLEQQSKAKELNLPDEKLQEMRHKIRADVEREYSPLKEQLEQLTNTLGERDGRIRELTLDNRVKEMMGKAGARAERVNDLFRLTGDRFDLTEDDAVILRDSRETPLDRYFKETLSKEYPEFWNGSGSSGGGASKSSGGAAGATRTIAAGDRKAFMSNLEAIAKGEVEVVDVG